MRRASLLSLVTAVVVTLASGAAVHQLASTPAGAAPLERAVVELAPNPPVTTLQHSAVLGSLSTPEPASTPATPASPAPAPAPAPAPPAADAPAPAREPAPVAAAGVPATGTCEADLHRWTNDARADRGIAPLAFDDVIVHVPRAWSEHMAAEAHLAHNPDHADQIWQARPEARKVSENVGRGHDLRAVFDAFMASPTHRANILDGSLTASAAGCVRDAGGQAWIAVDFWG